MHRPSFGVIHRVVVAAFLAAFLYSCTKESAPRADADVVVAEVNGRRITLKDLKNEIAARRGFTPSLSARSATRSEASGALRILVERTVVLAEGEKLGVSVSGSEVDREVDRFRSDFPPGGLEKSLLQAGTDMEAWRTGLARFLLVRKTSEAIAAARASVSPEEVEAEFRRRARRLSRPERIRVRQFLFDTAETAGKARAMILDGEKPEKVVSRFSEGDIRPVAVDLGEVGREDLPEEIAGELFALKEGDVSGVITREGGFNLFLVVEKEPARTLILASAAPEIREDILRVRREEAFRSWLTAQVGKADIRVQEALLDQFVGGGK